MGEGWRGGWYMENKRKAKGSKVKGRDELENFFGFFGVLHDSRSAFFFNYRSRKATSSTTLCSCYRYGAYSACYLPI